MQSLQAWLLGQGGDSPLLLVVEDLHWSDPSSSSCCATSSTSCRSGRRCCWSPTAATSSCRGRTAPARSGSRSRRLTARRRSICSMPCPGRSEFRGAGGDPCAVRRRPLVHRGIHPRLLQARHPQHAPAALHGAPRHARRCEAPRPECAAVLSPHLETDLLSVVCMPEDVVRTGLSRLVGTEVLSHAAALPRELVRLQPCPAPAGVGRFHPDGRSAEAACRLREGADGVAARIRRAASRGRGRPPRRRRRGVGGVAALREGGQAGAGRIGDRRGGSPGRPRPRRPRGIAAGRAGRGGTRSPGHARPRLDRPPRLRERGRAAGVQRPWGPPPGSPTRRARCRRCAGSPPSSRCAGRSKGSGDLRSSHHGRGAVGKRLQPRRCLAP